MSSKTRTPNDQRSIALNPNNPAYKAAQDARSVQMNQPPAVPPAEGGEKAVDQPPPAASPATGGKDTPATKR